MTHPVPFFRITAEEAICLIEMASQSSQKIQCLESEDICEKQRASKIPQLKKPKSLIAN
jgi:hypothetical protein